MAAVAETNPLFDILRDIEVRSRQRALGIPSQVVVRESWSGIGFRVGDIRLVAEFGEISELLPYPSLTRVPSALPWVMGLANIRGTLMPILDLGNYVDGNKTDIHRRSRVLVVSQDNVAAGLLVDEVFGLRHFYEEDQTEMFPQISQQLMGYLNGAYHQNGVYWGIFSMPQLCQDPVFREVAAR